MSHITLGDAERSMFALYCKQEAANNAGLAKQMEALGTDGPMKMLADQHKQRAAAFLIVAAEVDPASYEREEIRG